jgi:hypothetical protein
MFANPTWTMIIAASIFFALGMAMGALADYFSEHATARAAQSLMQASVASKYVLWASALVIMILDAGAPIAAGLWASVAR